MIARPTLREAVLDRLRVVKSNKDGSVVAWCPLHADGEGKPPHHPNLRVFERGFKCHACGEKGPLTKLAETLGIECSRPDNIEHAYDYRSAVGEVHYQVVRTVGKGFFQRRPDGKGGWINGLGKVKPVLYQLPELLANPDGTKFIVEGEKDANRLATMGLIATTNSGGAGKWRKEYAETFRGQHVVVITDNDKVGRDHANVVATSLVGIAASVKFLDLPGLPPKGDVSDWLAAGGTLEKLLALVESTPEFTHQAVAAESPISDSEGSTRSESLAKKIIEHVLDSGIELFHDERREPYARVATKTGKRLVPIGSRAFRQLLAGIAWKSLGKAPGGEVLSAAALTIGSMASLDHEQHQLWVRHAAADDSLWVDLDGSKAIRITAQGWEIIENPPILFRSFPHQRPLPIPGRGGDPWAIFDFLNLADEDSRTLLKGFLVAAFVPNVPVAGLALHGVQGSAKSSLFRAIKRVLDPSIPEVRRGIKDASDLAQVLFQNRIVFIDNQTSLPNWQSDALCGAITGDGWSKRALYTDEDSITFEYRRVVGVGGINLVVEKADLLDRCILLELPPIPKRRKRPEEEFWNAFECAIPGILGGLCDIVSRAMAAKSSLQITEMPRMADFSRWGAAGAVAEGTPPEVFLDAYNRNISRQSEAALDASPVGEALKAFMETRTEWSGTPGELYAELRKMAESLHIDTRAKSWPKAANWMSHRLKEVQPSLEAKGIRVEIDRSGERRKMRVIKGPVSCVIGVTTAEGQLEAGSDGVFGDATTIPDAAPCVTSSVTRNGPPGRSPAARDAGDGSDATSATRLGDRSGSDEDAELHDSFEERAGIIEFDAGLGRLLAEEKARRSIGGTGHA